jgi:hypothetical protein
MKTLLIVTFLFLLSTPAFAERSPAEARKLTLAYLNINKSISATASCRDTDECTHAVFKLDGICPWPKDQREAPCAKIREVFTPILTPYNFSVIEITDLTDETICYIRVEAAKETK